METKIEYEKDYYSWLMKNAGLLRDSRFSEIDADHNAFRNFTFNCKRIVSEIAAAAKAPPSERHLPSDIPTRRPPTAFYTRVFLYGDPWLPAVQRQK
jgi:hypothetical protein